MKTNIIQCKSNYLISFRTVESSFTVNVHIVHLRRTRKSKLILYYQFKGTGYLKVQQKPEKKPFKTFLNLVNYHNYVQTT